MTTEDAPGTRLRVDDWTALLTALCSDAPARIGTLGTLGEPGTMTLVQPTRFPWLRGFHWKPVGDDFGVALLDLADPGTIPAADWEPLCGPLDPGPPTRKGPILFGRFEAAGREATISLVTDYSAEGAQARVIDVRIRIEPV